MPFKDTNEGQTHSYNDGCGEPAHNDIAMNDTIKDKQKKIIAWAVLKNKEPLTNQTSLYFDDIIGFSKVSGKAMAQQFAKDMNEFVTNKGDKYTVKKVIINY